ncbi:hypothetical protein BDQ17DRAFT_1258487, partial [Cyathus striatus]
KRKVTTKQCWVGDYDYNWLCTPSLPFMKRERRMPPFYALDADLPLILAISSGLQHALAMLAGLITPPIIFAPALKLSGGMSKYQGTRGNNQPRPSSTRIFPLPLFKWVCRTFTGSTFTWITTNNNHHLCGTVVGK